MKYFSYLPQIEYSDNLATNLLARGKVREMVKENASAFYNLTISEGDRPDMVSENFYGSSVYTWIIFYVNDIFDPIHDWPLFYNEFSDYMKERYGNGETIVANSPNVYFEEATQSLVSEDSSEMEVLSELQVGRFLQIRNTIPTLINATYSIRGVVKEENRVRVILTPENTIAISFAEKINDQAPNEAGGLVTVEFEQPQRVVKNFKYVNGLIVDKNTFVSLSEPLRSMESVWEWEERLNDEKRTIRMVERQYISVITNELRKLF